MSVTWGGFAPAPEPAPEQRMLMSLIPYIAENILRPQTQQGIQENAFREAQIEAMKQKMRLEQEAFPGELAERGARTGSMLAGTRATDVGTERGKTLLPFDVTEKGQNITERGVDIETKRRVARELLTGQPRRELAEKYSLLLDESRIADADARLKEQQRKAYEAVGEQDFSNWEPGEPTTLPGKMFARKLRRLYLNDESNQYTKAVSILTRVKSAGGNQDMLAQSGISPEMVEEAKNMVRMYKQEMERIDDYLKILPTKSPESPDDNIGAETKVPTEEELDLANKELQANPASVNRLLRGGGAASSLPYSGGGGATAPGEMPAVGPRTLSDSERWEEKRRSLLRYIPFSSLLYSRGGR